LGQAVRVQQSDAKGNATSFVVFREYPEFDRKVRRGVYDVQFRGSDQQYATGLQVGKVPWVPFIFGGFVIMFVGMFMAFFMSHRRYWSRLSERPDGKWDLVVAGAARRHQDAFADDIEKRSDVLLTDVRA